MSFTERNEIVFGPEGVERLKNSTVAVYGLGGVGAAAAVSLVRSGVGHIRVTDFDVIAESNLNRLIFGFENNVGMKKTDVFSATARAINPDVDIIVSGDFMHGDNASSLLHEADFHIDAIDSLNPKVCMIEALLAQHQDFISSMGTGGKVRPEMLEIADIWKTDVCQLAKFVRKRLRGRGVRAHFPVVFSRETAVAPVESDDGPGLELGRTRKTQGSTVFVPQCAGIMAAGYAVRRLLGLE